MHLQSRVESKLRHRFEPAFLEVTNESSMHSVPVGSETHLKVIVVSSAFSGKSAVERHRLVYAALGDEIRDGLHALSVTSRSPEEWEHDREIEPSPVCHGGSRR